MFECSLEDANGAAKEDKRNFRGWQQRLKGTNINPTPGPPCPYSDVPLHPDPRAALHPVGSTRSPFPCLYPPGDAWPCWGWGGEDTTHHLTPHTPPPQTEGAEGAASLGRGRVTATTILC